MNTTNDSAAGAGTARRKRSTFPARRREDRRQVTVDGQPELAGYRAVEPGPAAVQMWPLESGTWLQPEFCVVAPRSAGMQIERRSRVAGRTFACIEATPARGNAALNTISELVADGKPVLPAGDLRPLGWDARTILKWKGGV